MIEPTESESLREIDRFCDAMTAIRSEISEVENGQVPVEESCLRLAPHTGEAIATDQWDRPYTRRQAVFPGTIDASQKYWPPVARIDNAYGDRHLFCTCS